MLEKYKLVSLPFFHFDIYSDIKFIQIFQNFMAVAQACTEKSCFVWDNKRVE